MNGLLFVLIILAIVQGIAEFLPISSSGHLVIFEQIKFFKEQLSLAGEQVNLFINVALHVSTLLAVIIYLWKDLVFLVKGFFKSIFSGDTASAEVKTSINIIAASLPAGILGIIFHDYFEKIFSSNTLVFILLIINGFILIITKKIRLKSRNIEEIGLIRSIFIGFFQALAMLPGISRSGMTIAGGMFNGLKPIESARFSFLMAIPVIGGAGLIEGIKAARGAFPQELLMPILISMLISFIVALFSLKLLFSLVKQIRINIFGYYTILLGIIGLIGSFFMNI